MFLNLILYYAAVILVCVLSFTKQRTEFTQRSINWSHLEEWVKSANFPAMQLESRFEFFQMLKKTVHFIFYVLHVQLNVTISAHTIVCTYSIYKEAPEGGPLWSETCRADI